MLSNAYFLAKFRFDTAENEPVKNSQNFAKIAVYSPFGLGAAPKAAPLSCGSYRPEVEHAA